MGYILLYAAAMIAEVIMEHKHSAIWSITHLFLFWFVLDGFLHAVAVFYVVPVSMKKASVEYEFDYNLMGSDNL